MITILCTYWKGSFRGRGYYTEEWVQRLQNLVKTHLTIKHEFICLTNVDKIEGVKTIRLKQNWIGWWSKLEMFRDDIPGNRFMSLDLAVLPIRNFDSLFDIKGKLIFAPANKKINNKVRPPVGLRLKNKRIDAYPSPGIIQLRERKFTNGVMIWDKYYPTIMYDIMKCMPIQDMEKKSSRIWMEGILSAYDIAYDILPNNTTVSLRELGNDSRKISKDCSLLVCSPGIWKPNRITSEYKDIYDWVEQIWKGEKVLC